MSAPAWLRENLAQWRRARQRRPVEVDRTVLEVAGGEDDGLRVVAVAMKELAPDQLVYSKADESGLTLIGYIAFLMRTPDAEAPAGAAILAYTAAELDYFIGDARPKLLVVDPAKLAALQKRAED